MRNKREKFVVIAERRVNRVLRDLHLVGNLGNKNNYAYNADDVRKIFAALEAELRAARKRFDDSNAVEETQFKLR
jgi:hypothetical protein